MESKKKITIIWTTVLCVVLIAIGAVWYDYSEKMAICSADGYDNYNEWGEALENCHNSVSEYEPLAADLSDFISEEDSERLMVLFSEMKNAETISEFEALKVEVDIIINNAQEAQEIARIEAEEAAAIAEAELAAKEWIAMRESGGSYTATNGRFYGRYQLDLAYLNGDTSIENQEATVERYVHERYGSWVAAKQFWLAHNWY